MEGKKKKKKRARILYLDDANYDLESNDSRNVLSRCRFKIAQFFQK